MKELKGDLGGPTPGGNDADKPRHYKDAEGPSFQVNQVQKYLKGADYPMDGKALSELARKNGADPELVEAHSALPELNGPNRVQSELKDHLGGKPGDA